jgi:hypothetical protein
MHWRHWGLVASIFIFAPLARADTPPQSFAGTTWVAQTDGGKSIITFEADGAWEGTVEAAAPDSC